MPSRRRQRLGQFATHLEQQHVEQEAGLRGRIRSQPLPGFDTEADRLIKRADSVFAHTDLLLPG